MLVVVDKTAVDIEFYAVGDVIFDDNYIYNCTSSYDLIVINSDDDVTLEQNIFDSCLKHENAFLVIKGTKFGTIDNLIVTNTVYDDTVTQSPVISISTKDFGNVYLNDLEFFDNSIGSSMVYIDSSVGNLTFVKSYFHNETMSSDVEYIDIANPYTLDMEYLTFYDCHDDHNLIESALLIHIRSIDLNETGDVKISNILSNYCPIGFMQLSTVSGNTTETKSIAFDHITIKNATFLTTSDIFKIGSFETDQDIDISMEYLTMQDLYFQKFANIIHMVQQSANPFRLEHLTMSNIDGGKILLQAYDIREDSEFAKMYLNN